MGGELVMRSMDIDRDAEALARMWNESDDQWPGSWTGGVPMTAERVRRWYEDEDALDVLVWATSEGAIVGYCSLQKSSGEDNVGYVELLNVHPKYQKRSLARKFLTECVERCVKLGFRRLDLDTWPGNLKAVPLYKKTGFFWMPDTQVDMFNFVPGILQLPCTRPYFDKHDWYRTFVRKLEQCEDDERWRGMKVFTYRWEEGDDALIVWVDREGRAITAVETNVFFAAAIPDNIKPPKGSSAGMQWEIHNKSDKPLNVSLVARGTEHLRLDHRESFAVAPGETIRRSALVKVDAKTPRVPERKPAPKIETLLLINGELLELGSGFHPEPAVIVETMPRWFAVAPGVERALHVQVRNELELMVEAHVDLIAPLGLEIDRQSFGVTLAGHGHSGFPLKVKAEEPGVYLIQASIKFLADGKQGEAAIQELPVVALYPGQVMAFDTEDAVCVVSSRNAFEIRREGGRLISFDLESDRWLGEIAAEYGPPFDPSEFRFRKAELSWRQDAGNVVVTSEQVSERFSGLTLLRELHFTGGPLVRAVYRTLNRGEKAHSPEFAQRFARDWSEEYQITLPLRAGLVHASTRGFPRGDEDCPRKSEKYAEKWISLEGVKSTIGLIWNRAFQEVEYEWDLSLRRPKFECRPHEWAETFESWFYVGPGDWREVQAAYRLLDGRGEEALLKQPAPIVELSLEPRVPLFQGSELSATLKLENKRQRVLQGGIELSASEGWNVEPKKFVYDNVDRVRPFTVPIVLRCKQATAGGYTVKARLSTRLDDTTHDLPFVCLGPGGQVDVQAGEEKGQPIWTIDNGHARFVVAPDFSGAVVAWVTPDGHNHLDTDFPKPTARSWLAPWYGGIWPILWKPGESYPGKLYGENWTSSPMETRDTQGLAWQGVRLMSELQREPLRGLAVEIDYLTTGGSQLLKAVLRVVNRTEAICKVEGGWATFWAPDGNASENVLYGEDWQSKRTDFMDAWIHAGYWGAVVNPATGTTAIVVCPEPIIKLMDEGRSATSLNPHAEMTIPPLADMKRVVYFVVASDLSLARAYACLKDAK